MKKPNIAEVVFRFFLKIKICFKEEDKIFWLEAEKESLVYQEKILNRNRRQQGFMPGQRGVLSLRQTRRREKK